MDVRRLKSHESLIGGFPRGLVPGACADSVSCLLLKAASGVIFLKNISSLTCGLHYTACA